MEPLRQTFGRGANSTREQNKYAGQSRARKSNIRSNKTPTKALISPEAPTLPKAPVFLEVHTPLLVSSIKDLFIKLMKVFMELTQIQTKALAEL